MLRTLSKTIASIAAGLLIALPFTPIAPAFVQIVQAAPGDSGALTTDDFLKTDFVDSTGLGEADLQETIGNLIRVALGFLGVFAVCIVLWGGFKWMTAGGNDEKVSEAKRLLIAGLIGIAIILSAYAIVEFVISNILIATGNE